MLGVPVSDLRIAVYLVREGNENIPRRDPVFPVIADRSGSSFQQIYYLQMVVQVWFVGQSEPLCGGYGDAFVFIASPEKSFSLL